MATAKNETTNNEELLQLAIRAAKSGQADGARVMLRQVYARNKRNETALMWLAKLSKNQKEREKWLREILEINPENEAAKKALGKMRYRREAANNRTLMLFGAVAVILLVVVAVIVVIALTA